MEKLIDYFIDESSKKDSEYIIKERLIVLFSIFMGGLALLMIPTYMYLDMSILLNFLYLLVLGSIIILFYFKYSQNLQVTTFLFITFCLIFFSLNIIYTGAINSVLVIWLTVLPILAILLDNGFITYSLIGISVLIITLVIFEEFAIVFPNEMETKSGLYLNLFSRLNFMNSVLLIIYFYNKKRVDDKRLLEKSNADLEQFAYVASHDMKAPLRNIMSFIQLLQKKLKGNQDVEIKQYLQHILNNGYQMNELIHDILNISKINRQEGIVYSNTDLNIVLGKVKSNLKNELNNKNATINADKLPTIVANEPQIVQLFQNLIENGIKYNRNPNPVVTITFEIKDNQLNCFFKDNGIGIAPEFHHKIFEMFKRLHSGFEFKGTGIGLAICKKIALIHTGDLVVNQSSNKGTTFKLSLPINK